MKNKKEPPSIIGKTIKEVDTSCFNVIHITFMDDTKISISAENSRLGIPAMLIEDGWIFE